MNLRPFFPSILSKHRKPNKRPAGRPAFRGYALQVEALESRYAPATFTVLDTFDKASDSDATVNTGGTATNAAAGIFINSDGTRNSDSGTDTALRTATQFADTRIATLTKTADNPTGNVRAQTEPGSDLDFNSSSPSSATLVLTYDGLSSVNGKTAVLNDDAIAAKFLNLQGDSIQVELRINNFLMGALTATPNAGPFTLTFDAAAFPAVAGPNNDPADFVDTSINSIALTFIGKLGTDFQLDEIDASFATVDANITLAPLSATNPVGQNHTLTATVQQDDGLPANDPGGDAVTGFGPAPDGTVVVFSLTPSYPTVTFIDDLVNSSPVGDLPNPTNDPAITAFNNGNDAVVAGGNGQAATAINSSAAGTVTIHASTTFNVREASLTRATSDNVSGGSTGTATSGAANTLVDTTQTWTINQWTNSQVKITAGTGAGQTRTIVSNTATQLTVATNWATPPDNTSVYEIQDGPDATKTYVDANIILSPPTSSNEVNKGHTFTAFVQQNDGLPAGAPGDGVTGYGPVPDGTTVTFTITDTKGTASLLDDTSSTVDKTTTAGLATVDVNSANATTLIIRASVGDGVPGGTAFSVGGVSLTRATNDNVSGGTNGTATGGSATTLADTTQSWTADQWTNALVTITAGTGSGQTRTIASNTATVLTVATAWTTAPDDTSKYAILDSADATKIYVDANIIIGPPTATNPVGQAHTLTITVQQNDGLPAGAPGGDAVTGYGPVPDGTVVHLSIISGAATFVTGTSPTQDKTTTSGTFTVDITSITAGSNTIRASVGDGVTGGTAFSVGGVSLTRATNDNVSGGTNGTATGGSATTLADTTQSWTTDQWKHALVTITAGTGSGQTRTIASNTATVLTVATAWTTPPDNTSKYAILDSADAVKIYEASPAGGTATQGFWHNKNGQAVIKSAATIGDDLALLYPNLFGAGAAAFDLSSPGKKVKSDSVTFMNLTGRSAADVAAYFLKLFNVKGPHAQSQVVSNVLAAYFDSINNTAQAQKFGFGGNLFNTAITLTSSQAAALSPPGFPSLPTSTTVGAYLNRVNALMATPPLPPGQNGVIPASLFNVFNDVSDMINNLNHV